MADYFTTYMPASEVLSIEPHFEGVGQGTALSSSLIQGAGVTGKIDADLKSDRKVLDFTYRLMSNAEQFAFHQFFAKRYFGGQSFYVPTWTNDFEVVASVAAGASSLTVRANNFGTWYDQVAGVRVDNLGGPWGYTYFGLLVITTDNNRHFFRLGKASTTTIPSQGPAEPGVYVDNGNGTATLYIRKESADPSFQKTYSPEEISLCSLILRGRLSDSSLVYNTQTTAIVDVRIGIQGVLFEDGKAEEPPPVEADWSILLETDDTNPIKTYWIVRPDDKLELEWGGQSTLLSLTGGAPPTGYVNYNDTVNISVTAYPL